MRNVLWKSTREPRHETRLESEGKVKFTMYEYIEKMLKGLLVNIERLATTPSSSYLFNTGCKKLCKEQRQLFYHLVLKLLRLSNHTRQGIQTAVALLCTRVRDPDTDDYKKLTKVMQYLRNTRNMTLTIQLEDKVKWWVDSSYVLHPEMKHHT